VDKQLKRDVEINREIDVIVNKRIDSRRSSIRGIVPYESNKMNFQNHDYPQMDKWNRTEERMSTYSNFHDASKKIPIRIVELPRIKNKLFLCDHFQVEDFVADDTTIINLSGLPIDINRGYGKYYKRDKKENFHIYNIDFEDSRRINYNNFMKILLEVIAIIDNQDFVQQNTHARYEHKFVVSCHKGVNRSVAAIIGYVIQKDIMTFEEALGYIHDIKMEKDNLWYSLNNLQFMKYLKKMETEKRRQLRKI